MSLMWEMSIDDYIKICEISVAVGIKPGESMEIVLREYMKTKGKKPSMTDLTKDELIEKLVEDGKGILDIETDKNGEQDRTFFKKDEDTLKTDQIWPCEPPCYTIKE